MTATIIPFPAPRVQLIQKTGYPRWASLRAGGVRHRIFAVWTEGRRVYFEAMCGVTGSIQSEAGRDCARCRNRGWVPGWDEPL